MAELIKVPPDTEAFAPNPAVMVVIPLVTTMSPPETLRFGRSIEASKVPFIVVIEPLILPPVRLTDPFSR